MKTRQTLVQDDPRDAAGRPAHFLHPIIECRYDGAPLRVPEHRSYRPRLDEPVPRFLDDAQAAAFMTAARNLPGPLDRLMVTALAPTGMRRGELPGLTLDTIVQIGTGYWLRTPVGKRTPTGTSRCIHN